MADEVDVSVSSDLESSEELLAQESIRPKANAKIVGRKRNFSFVIEPQYALGHPCSLLVINGACEGVTSGGHAAVKFTHCNLGTLNIRPFLDFSAEGYGR